MVKFSGVLFVSAACALVSGCIEGGARDTASTTPSGVETNGVSKGDEPSRPSANSASSSTEAPTPSTQTPPQTDGSATGAAPTDLASRPIAAASSGPNYTSLMVSATTDVAPMASDGVGAFRVVCAYSHMAFDDPIVFPGKPGASHLHTFFGNTGANGNSTTETLLKGGSNCWGGTANRSSYWVPSLVDTVTMRAIVPSGVLIYYKSGYNQIPRDQIQAPPNGLRIVTGNRVTQSAPLEPWEAKHYFDCDGANRGENIPLCNGGQTILSAIDFPNCWDGVNLDSVDHRSHMAFSGGGKCPASHPVAIPTISLHVSYKVPSGESSSNWRLASDNYSKAIPAGYSMHGDIWMAWDEDVKHAWMENCVRAGRDCHAHLLGDGRQVYGDN